MNLFSRCAAGIFFLGFSFFGGCRPGRSVKHLSNATATSTRPPSLRTVMILLKKMGHSDKRNRKRAFEELSMLGFSATKPLIWIINAEAKAIRKISLKYGIRFDKKFDLQLHAVKAVGLLKRVGLPAIPSLLRLRGKIFCYNFSRSSCMFSPTCNVLKMRRKMRRIQARKVLISFGEEGIPQLLKALSHPKLRELSVEVFMEFKMPNQRVIRSLKSLLKKDIGWRIKMKIARALGGFGELSEEVVPLIIDLLQPKNRSILVCGVPVNFVLIYVLGQIKKPGHNIYMKLKKMLQTEKDLSIRCAIFRSLSHLHPKRVLSILHLFSKSFKKATPLSRCLTDNLGRMGSKAKTASKSIGLLLSSKKLTVRMDTTVALCHIGSFSKEIRNKLLRVFKTDKDLDLRISVAGTLLHYSHSYIPQVFPFLRRMIFANHPLDKARNSYDKILSRIFSIDLIYKFVKNTSKTIIKRLMKREHSLKLSKEEKKALQKFFNQKSYRNETIPCTDLHGTLGSYYHSFWKAQ